MIDFNKDVMPLKNKLYRLALRLLHDHEEAQDITQETLIRLWQRRDSLPHAIDAEKLGLTICHNLSLDALQRAGRDNETIDTNNEDLVPDNAQTPLEQLSTADQHQQLLTIINKLPAKQRAILQLREMEGKSYKEIAEILELTEEQVKVNLFRTRQSLKQLYKNNS